MASFIKMFLFCDTETSGLPNRPREFNKYYDVKKRLSDYDASRVVSIAFLFCDEKSGDVLHEDYAIIKPEGFRIPESKFHDVTHDQAMSEGISLQTFFLRNKERLDQSTSLIGHNINFDFYIVLAELQRKKMTDFMEQWKALPRFCTQINAVSTSLISLGKTLGSLAGALCPSEFKTTKLHHALGDSKLTKSLYFCLKEKYQSMDIQNKVVSFGMHESKTLAWVIENDKAWVDRVISGENDAKTETIKELISDLKTIRQFTPLK